MRNIDRSGFDAHLEQVLKKNPIVAREYAKQFAELPLQTQLAILRRRKWLSQKTLARKLRVKQPHIARVENPKHDPRLSSISSQAKALHCNLLIVPDKMLVQVAALVAAGHGT